MSYYLGIEIGGTKLQLGVGADDGVLAGLWRGTVDAAAGPEGIRRQITRAVPELLAKANIDRFRLKGVGVGFGGPVDDATRTVIKSHQIEGWDDFPLADWVSEVVGLPAALGNDADVAGLAEALHGAEKGYRRSFISRLAQASAAASSSTARFIGALAKGRRRSGILWSIRSHRRSSISWREWRRAGPLRAGCPPGLQNRTIRCLGRGGGAAGRRRRRLKILSDAWDHLADAIRHVVVLLCPRRIVIGGGVSLMGEPLFFGPLRRKMAERTFKPFADCYDIAPAALGEEVVVHGAIGLVRRKLGHKEKVQ